ncbi:MAG TPA: Uma2 family endonuclease, partial [Polyangiaceae bacterium]|nr:Uma2 family endonuclease [Polyangiaceae bacterium]
HNGRVIWLFGMQARRTPSAHPPDYREEDFPVEERLGEDILQRWIMELLRPLIERWLVTRGSPSFVGADQFIYFDARQPAKRVAPDIYVLPGVALDTDVQSWKTWEARVVPSFALEVCSQDWRKDYEAAPALHEQIGTQELIIFDPRYEARSDGLRFQRYERVGDRLLRRETTSEDRVPSRSLGCYLRLVGSGMHQRLRLALHPDGEHLFPTGEEAERLAKEAERLAKEAERQAKEAERQAKEAALARVAELEALLKAQTSR